MDTIFAQATAPGKAGIAVIRVSGPDAVRGCSRLCGPLPEMRRAALRTIRTFDGEMIDEGIVLCFPDGASFTGEPVVELQMHGSVAVIQAILKELACIDGFRIAEAGEFTRRALDNDRLDLTQVEGLADLIDSETELQRQQALSVLSGALSTKVEIWRRPLVEAAALLEVSLDFSDEDVPQDVVPMVLDRLDRLRQDLHDELETARIAERVRNGFEVAIMGPPNAGKSTLLNSIARRPVALTSEIAGTTRDVLEVRIDLHGLPITLLDTAGIRESGDQLERAGIALAKRRSAEADIRVWLSVGGHDVPAGNEIVREAKDDDGRRGGVSGITGQGVDALLKDVADLLMARMPRDRLLVRARHEDAIRRAADCLDRARDGLVAGMGLELIAIDLRQAATCLTEIIGGLDVEDLLDDIFKSFCIGK